MGYMTQENNPDKSLANKSALISWYLSLIGFFGIFSTTISKNPVLPLFVKGLGASASLLGIIAAASPLAGMLLSFPIGFLADKIGRRRLLLIAALIFISAPLLYLCVTNPLWLIPIRFFHGLATAIMGPVASALIIGFYSKSKGEKLGLYSSATLFGRTLAPLLGGFLINLLAYRQGLFNYHAVYLTAFISSLPVLFLTLAIPKTAAAAEKNSAGKKRTQSDTARYGSNEGVYNAHPSGALPRDVFTDISTLAGGAGMKERYFLLNDKFYLPSEIKNLTSDEKSKIIKHPTQKPFKLTERLLLSSKPESNGFVVIPFGGSGSEGIVCKKLGLDFIGFDINETYINMSNQAIINWKNIIK
jgi:MFS family permease